MADIKLSIIIPAYNEALRIAPTIEKIKAFLRAKAYPSEIIVVDDGSSDRTAEIASDQLKDFPHLIIQNERNRGKGYSVKTGMLSAKGLYRLFSDADLSTPIEETDRFLDQLEHGGYDCVIGSRDLPDSRVEIHQNWLREIMGKVFNRLARLFSFRSIHDSQCGFKGFRRDAAQKLFALQKLEGFSFDAEIIFLAQKMGYRILETPVTWRNSSQSRVQIFKDPLAMFVDLMRIRFIHRGL